MNHMFKKYLIGVSIVAVFALAVSFTHAYVSYNGFTFDRSVKTRQGTEYFVDLIQGPNLVTMSDGRYDLEAALGFYGTTDPSTDRYFYDDIESKINVWYKKKGARAYEHMTEMYSTVTGAVPGSPGKIIYKLMRSSGNGFFVDPGEYTVDAIMEGRTVIASYDVCLPTFTSDTGRSIGNVTCGSSTSPGSPGSTGDVSPTPPTPSVTTDTVPYSPTELSFTPTSVLAPDTEAKIKGLLKSPTNTTQKIEFWVGLKSSRKGKLITSDPILITPAGFPLSVTAADLKKNGKYEYGFRVSGQTTDFFTGSFSTGVASDQAGIPTAEKPSPTESPSSISVTFAPTSVLATGTSLNLKGTFSASAETTEKFDLYVWPVGGIPQKIQSSDPIYITSAKFPVTFLPVNALQKNTRYQYRLVAVTSNTPIYENSFSTNVPADQAGLSSSTNPDDGVCGTATD
ncbi:hypothetical protein EBR96_07825, partial [bacterium]|nr:hypothetical protein [bacterium]